MRIMVVGFGSIARRHITNLKAIEPNCSVGVWRQASRRGALEGFSSLIDIVVHRLEDAIAWKPDAAVIASPAPFHVPTGIALARAGVHLLVEKPLSNSLDGIDTLVDLCCNSRLTATVGYNFRYCRPLQLMRQALIDGKIGRPLALRAEVGQYLPEWRPGSDYRSTVSARRELGGGALLELSHELDSVRWFLGEVATVSAAIHRLSDLEIDVEDSADLVLQLRSGVVASVHVDMLRQPASRTCCVLGTRGTLLWDGNTHQVIAFSAESQTWCELHPANAIERNDMYVAEMRHFLKCVQGDESPVVDLIDGRRALEIVLAARQSAAEKRVVEL